MDGMTRLGSFRVEMAKLSVKVWLEPGEYHDLKRAIEENHLYGSESAAGRRAFYLLRLEREGKLETHDKKKPWY